ncbi:MAG: hypothetical protein ACT6QS_18000 [Flavobacteriales bacterium]
MNRSTESEIVSWLKEYAEPVEDTEGNLMYAAAVWLRDDTYLPCVLFQNTHIQLDRLRGIPASGKGRGLFSKGKNVDDSYLIRNFLQNDNRIYPETIQRLERSLFAFPDVLRDQIEVRVNSGVLPSWFSAKMKDGTYLGFETTYEAVFYDLPDGYSADDILEIQNNTFVSESGIPESVTAAFAYGEKTIALYSPRIFFNCFLSEL